MGAKLLNTKIIVVEDNISLSEAMKIILSQEGASVYTSFNGEEGLQICSKMKPDLIITDITMPRMSGLEMIEGLKSFDGTKYIPVIVITASAMKKQVEEAIRLGAASYLVKPVRAEDLISKVMGVLSC